MGIVRSALLASAIAGWLASSVAACAAPVNTEPPPGTGDVPSPAPTVDVVDHPFGVALPDPYRWMEGRNNVRFDAWLKGQGEYARGKLDALPTLAAWRERLKQANGAMVFNAAIQRAGGKTFFLRVGETGRALMARLADGTQQVLFDPAQAGGGEAQGAIQSYAPSPDGRRVAINIGLGAGQEISRIRVLDTETLTWLPDMVEPVWGEFAANWLPDGSGFTYTRMAPENERPGGDPMQGMRVHLHRLGAPVAGDPVLLRAGDGRGANPRFRLAANEFALIAFAPGSRWALALAGGARSEARLCVAPATTAVKPGAPWRCVAAYADGVQDGALRGDRLYLLAVRGHPNGRVLALDLSQPDAKLDTARVMLPMANDAVITQLVAARDALYVQRMRDGRDEVLRVDYTNGEVTVAAMPFAGAIHGRPGLAADPMGDGVALRLRGWTRPGVVFAWGPGEGALRETGLRDVSPGDYDMLTSIETEAVSADGTRVPLSVIQRKDIKLDGRHRALVEAYGYGGISMQPQFDPNALQWVKAGAVYAACHVRGGGEKGDAWQRAGQGANRHHSAEDFVACAEELARRGYTTRQRTALTGTSGGGMLLGEAIARFPDRFGAALVNVGLLNPVRILAGGNGANQIASLGDPRTATGLQALAAMDPYQNLRTAVNYPAILFQVGLQDDRVAPWHTGKFAAKLMAANTSGRPVWIRTDEAQGHFAFSLGGEAAQAADQYAFLDAVLPVD